MTSSRPEKKEDRDAITIFMFGPRVEAMVDRLSHLRSCSTTDLGEKNKTLLIQDDVANVDWKIMCIVNENSLKEKWKAGLCKMVEESEVGLCLGIEGNLVDATQSFERFKVKINSSTTVAPIVVANARCLNQLISSDKSSLEECGARFLSMLHAQLYQVQDEKVKKLDLVSNSIFPSTILNLTRSYLISSRFIDAVVQAEEKSTEADDLSESPRAGKK